MSCRTGTDESDEEKENDSEFESQSDDDCQISKVVEGRIRKDVWNSIKPIRKNTGLN